jgi:hypothetical protein
MYVGRCVRVYLGWCYWLKIEAHQPLDNVVRICVLLRVNGCACMCLNYIRMYVCMYVCMRHGCVCMCLKYMRMYVCMYVNMYV